MTGVFSNQINSTKAHIVVENFKNGVADFVPFRGAFVVDDSGGVADHSVILEHLQHVEVDAQVLQDGRTFVKMDLHAQLFDLVQHSGADDVRKG